MEVFIAMKALAGEAHPDGDIRCAAAAREQLAGLVAEAVHQAGHTPFVATQEIARQSLAPAQFMPFVRQRIQQAGLVIVIYDAELRGGLIEEGIAYAVGVPIWLLHRRGERVSSSARACATLVIEYAHLPALRQVLELGFASLR